ncbi:hypothetical protein COV19_04665 [Candidatus Woesearchaeota archaeon CG10_big_fil_rev_8_21_14_0_10_44_13]|nr:MAG: hypothetical protein COV19_04665 [Candidatus Woesearchaeota archaeon CG10_big_fil_rev_8_21_14_0_10_44_13]
MIWVIFASIGAFLDSTYYMLNKKLVQKLDIYFVPACVFFFTFLATLIISLARGLPDFNATFFIAILITSALNIIAIILYLSALKTTDISLCIPLISFTPLFLILTSYLILGEFPSYMGIAGIFLIVFGSYILGFRKDKKGILATFKHLLGNRGALYLFIVAFIFSIALNFDKLAVLNSDTTSSLAAKSLVLSASFMAISSFKSKNKLVMFKSSWKMLLIAGLVLAVMDICINIAYTMTLASYVIAIKRISIVFSTLYGHFLFREKGAKQRFFAALFMLAGAVMIALS